MLEMKSQERLEAEIRELHERLEAKKKELGSHAPDNEREVFKEVFLERMNELAMSIQGKANPPASAGGGALAQGDDSVRDIEKEETIKALLYVAFEKSPEEAIRQAEARGGPYFVDELHDRLADQYYDKLLEFRKIKQL